MYSVTEKTKKSQNNFKYKFLQRVNHLTDIQSISFEEIIHKHRYLPFHTSSHIFIAFYNFIQILACKRFVPFHNRAKMEIVKGT